MPNKKEFNKAEYDNKYIRKNVTRVSVVMSKKHDQDIIEALQNNPSKSSYLKQLIREDLKKT